MNLAKTTAALLVVLGAWLAVPAQVLTPMELAYPETQNLQRRHLETLMAIGTEIEAHKFPYPFYFSRVLDVEISKMQVADQRSIRFDIYKGQTVLEITGNYYAAYSANLMDPYVRLKETFTQVIVPILQAEVPHFPDDSEFSAFAIEVSHHVRQKILGVSSERPENVTVIIPVPVAQKFVDAKTDDQKQAAILDAEVFLNGEPYSLWLQEGAPSEEWKEKYAPRPAAKKPPVETASAAANPTSSNGPTVSANLLKPSPMPIFSPEALASLQSKHQDAIDRLVKGLDQQVQFFPYAPPVFIGFRQGAYLQLSFSTPIEAPLESSRYKLRALAFDEQVSHLIRPLLDYFPTDVDFDGVDFSSVIRVTGSSKTEAVEFFFLFRMMRCFAAYDCTVQQLLDSGTVLINGERAEVDLQVAEGKN